MEQSSTRGNDEAHEAGIAGDACAYAQATMIATLLPLVSSAADVDWLINTPTAKATFKRECWPEYETPTGQTPCGFALANGLTSRRFVLTPAFGTIDWILNSTLEYGGERSAASPQSSLRSPGGLRVAAPSPQSGGRGT